MNNLEIVISAINCIESNLTGAQNDLAQVAGSVHYSKYHLHRVFRQTVGMSIHDYVRRRRLTEAAKLLVFSQKPVLEIALLAGYDGQQSFSKAFKAMYKQAPHRFRKNEVFYPLQLKFNLEEQRPTLAGAGRRPVGEIVLMTEADIPCWMELVRLVIDGFPHLDAQQHLSELKKYIDLRSALLCRLEGLAVGGLLINRVNGSIDFLAVHPCYRQQGLAGDLLARAIAELLEHPQISITTFREGDQADTGHRAAVKALGFAEAELLTEFGYPTQKMILAVEEKHD